MTEEEKVTPVAEEATSMADYEKELEASFKKIEEGDMITGTVIAVDEEEITLDLRYYTEGIIKVSDYSREPGFMVKEEVHVGDEVTATVIGETIAAAVSCYPAWKPTMCWHGTNCVS